MGINRWAPGSPCCKCRAPRCRVAVRFVYLCPESDPDGVTMTARDVETDATFGPVPVTYDAPGVFTRSAEASVSIEVPSGEFPRDVRLEFDGADWEDELVTIEACEDVEVTRGVGADDYILRLTVQGCHLGHQDRERVAGVAVSVEGSDGSSGQGVTGEDGTVDFVLPLPESPAFITYAVSVGSSAFYEGEDSDIGRSLPARGTQCNRVESVVLNALDPAEGWVCTCLGMLPTELQWDGLSSATITHAGPNRIGGSWFGTETVPSSAGMNTDPICAAGSEEGPVSIDVEFQVTDAGACIPQAIRHGYSCWVSGSQSPYPECNGQGGTADRLWRVVSQPLPESLYKFFSNRVAVPLPRQDEYSSFEFPEDEWDVSIVSFGRCHIPEQLQGEVVVSWGGVGALMAFVLPPASGGSPEAAPPEPPLPSAFRMAGNLLRTGANVVTHAARTGQVRATESEQARRWDACRGCENFRPADRRCGQLTGCGCWLSRKIPLAASSCPLKPPKWGPEVWGGSAGASSERLGP